jgi:regulator of cell morphogenesis and NO signaling
MNTQTSESLLDKNLGQLARKIPGATAVFHEYGIDFCCGGNKSLRQSAVEKNLDSTPIETRLLELNKDSQPLATETMPLTELIDYILEKFHATQQTSPPTP